MLQRVTEHVDVDDGSTDDNMGEDEDVIWYVYRSISFLWMLLLLYYHFAHLRLHIPIVKAFITCFDILNISLYFQLPSVAFVYIVGFLW